MKLQIASFLAAVVILAYGVGKVSAQSDAERRPSFLDRIRQRLSEGLAPKRSPAETMTAAEGPAVQGSVRAGSAAAPSMGERPTLASAPNASPGIEPMPEPELDSSEPTADNRVPLHQKLHRYRASPFAVQSVPVWTIPQPAGAVSRDAAESPGEVTMRDNAEAVAPRPVPGGDVRVPTAAAPTMQRGPVAGDVADRPSTPPMTPSANVPAPDRFPPSRTLGEYSASAPYSTSAPAAAASTGPSMRPTLAPPRPQAGSPLGPEAGLVRRVPAPAAEQASGPMPAASPTSVERHHEGYVPALAGRSVANRPASLADAAAPEPRSVNGAAAARDPAAEFGRPGPSAEDGTGRDAVSNARAAETPAVASKTAGERVLINRTTPVLNVETIGPRRITVGREGLYTLQLKNQGQTPAKQVVVHVLIPSWAELSGAEPTDGTVAQQMEGDFRHLAWRVEELPASAAESLDLRIIPRASKPFDLAVQWEFAPPPSQASIEVQEPKLELRLDGPDTILFGQTQVYRLEVENSGTGDAENVTLTLVPPGSTGRDVIRHTLGTIPAGAKRVVELELVARQEGALSLVVDARDDLAAAAHLERTVTVLKPALEVVVQGPPMQFVGQEDWYEVTVRNPGTAPAEDVRVAVSLPSAVSLVAAPQGEVEDKQRAVRWTLDSLPPGKEAKFRLACRYEIPGTVRLAANAEGKNLAAQGEWLTQLETIADLALRVEDPQGPVPIGRPAEYRIILENRGTRAAEKVQVVGFFSEGIEATAADGAPNKILPGQVLFSPIRAIAPGEKVVLTIRATASKHGNLVFRAEASCPTGNIQLAAEESTYFFDVMVAGKEGETLQR